MQNFSITTVIDADTYNNFKILCKSISCPTSELETDAVRIYIENQNHKMKAIQEGV
jgi:hypothetical protein